MTCESTVNRARIPLHMCTCTRELPRTSVYPLTNFRVSAANFRVSSAYPLANFRESPRTSAYPREPANSSRTSRTFANRSRTFANRSRTSVYPLANPLRTREPVANFPLPYIRSRIRRELAYMRCKLPRIHRELRRICRELLRMCTWVSSTQP